MSKSAKTWRVNFVVAYQNAHFAGVYRKQVHETLQNIASFREIECVVSADHAKPGVLKHDNDEFLEDTVLDLVYFRSSTRTKISAADFRNMIELVFDNRLLSEENHLFEVFSQFV